MRFKIIIFFIAIFLIFNHDHFNTLSASNKISEKNSLNDSSYINKKLVSLIKDFIELNEQFKDFKPIYGLDEYYYSLKFFKHQDTLFFTIKASHNFPILEITERGVYCNDTSCMYYYNILFA